MDYLDYRDQLGIGYSNEEQEKAFKNRIINFLKYVEDIAKAQVQEREYFEYCNIIAVSADYFEWGSCYEKIVNTLEFSDFSFKEFLLRVVAFINCLTESEFKQSLIEYVNKALNETHIPVETVKDDDGYFIFPKGAKELDESLISEPLMWLNDYQNTKKKFSEALRRYSAIQENNISDVADDFRKALETFFQEFFASEKSVENLKSDYGNYLKKKGVPKGLANNFASILNTYESFMNDYAKHHDRTDEKALEYMMYETGNIIRLLIRLKNSD